MKKQKELIKEKQIIYKLTSLINLNRKNGIEILTEKFFGTLLDVESNKFSLECPIPKTNKDAYDLILKKGYYMSCIQVYVNGCYRTRFNVFNNELTFCYCDEKNLSISKRKLINISKKVIAEYKEYLNKEKNDLSNQKKELKRLYNLIKEKNLQLDKFVEINK